MLLLWYIVDGNSTDEPGDMLTQAGNCWHDSFTIFSHAIEVTNLGRSAEAIEAFERAMKIKPDHAEARYNLARELATQGKCEQAVDQYREVLRPRPGGPDCMNNLASAARFNEAVDTANRAMDLAEAANQPQVKNIIQYHLSFYTQGKPYIELGQNNLPNSNKPWMSCGEICAHSGITTT